MTHSLVAGVVALLVGGGLAALGQEDRGGRPSPLKDPGLDCLYYYRAELNQVVDGRTVALDLDLGFRVWLHKTAIRLQGIEVPAEAGGKAVAWLAPKLRDASELGELRVKTFPAPKGSDVAWVGVLFAGGKNVNEEMIELGLAKALPP